MIEAIRSIGEFAQEDTNSLDTFVENPNSNGKYNCVLLVALKEKDESYSFDHIEVEEFKGNKYQNYLYKRGSPNGTDLTPTTKVAASLDKTFQIKFLKWFENYEEYDVSDEDRKRLEAMKAAIESEKEKILVELNEKYAQKKKDDNALITLGIMRENETRYIGQIPLFQNILLKKGKDKYYHQKSKGISLGNDGVCFICKKKRNEVYGCAIPWKFHTFDKPGFIAGGFNFTDSWKDTPVCFECAKCLELGKKYVEENLSFDFCGFKYLLIPRLTVDGDYEEILDILGEKGRTRSIKNMKAAKTQISNENAIKDLEIIAEQKNVFTATFLFYRKDNSSYRILLSIEDILPSRLKELFKAKQRIDKIFEPCTDLLTDNQREKFSLKFDFWLLRQFFPYESQNRTYDKMFLELTNKIFIGDYIAYNLIISAIMRKIRDDFSKEYPTNYSSLSGFLLLNYINELGLFECNDKEMTNMKEDSLFGIEEYESLELEARAEAFFDKNKSFFDAAAKKAVFLEGILAQFLLNTQYRDKDGNTPFRSKLQGLKLNERLIKRLLPEMQNKLEEYDENYYKELEYLISRYFVLAGDKWNIADDDLSFYFVLGMNMSRLFRRPQNTNSKEAKHE